MSLQPRLEPLQVASGLKILIFVLTVTWQVRHFAIKVIINGIHESFISLLVLPTYPSSLLCAGPRNFSAAQHPLQDAFDGYDDRALNLCQRQFGCGDRTCSGKIFRLVTPLRLFRHFLMLLQLRMDTGFLIQGAAP